MSYLSQSVIWLTQVDTKESMCPHRVRHTVFMKATNTKYCELQSSARSWSAQAACMAPETVRRKLHVSEALPMQKRLEVLEEFTNRMLGSGYSRRQVRHCVTSGLVTYEKKREASLKNGKSIYRSFQEVSENRDIRKLVEKTTWLLDKDQEPTQNFLSSSARPGRLAGRRKKVHITKPQQKFQPVSVLFSPRTEAGSLQSALRQVEASLQQACPLRYKRIKVVEEGGRKLKCLLIRDHWESKFCGRVQCPCGNENAKPGLCTTRSVVYQNVCLLCEKNNSVSRCLGETSRTIWERNAEHHQDALSSTAQSHMKQHLLEKHPEYVHQALESVNISKIKACKVP